MKLVRIDYEDQLGESHTLIDTEDRFRNRCLELAKDPVPATEVHKISLDDLVDAVCQMLNMANIIVVDSPWDKESFAVFQEVMYGDYDVQPYKGRFHYDGPAVMCEDEYERRRVQEVAAQLGVQTTHDSMGLGYVVYPAD